MAMSHEHLRAQTYQQQVIDSVEACFHHAQTYAPSRDQDGRIQRTVTGLRVIAVRSMTKTSS